MKTLKKMDASKVARAVEDDAGHALPGLRESLVQAKAAAQAKAGTLVRVHTPEEIVGRRRGRPKGSKQEVTKEAATIRLDPTSWRRCGRVEMAGKHVSMMPSAHRWLSAERSCPDSRIVRIKCEFHNQCGCPTSRFWDVGSGTLQGSTLRLLWGQKPMLQKEGILRLRSGQAMGHPHLFEDCQMCATRPFGEHHRTPF